MRICACERETEKDENVSVLAPKGLPCSTHPQGASTRLKVALQGIGWVEGGVRSSSMGPPGGKIKYSEWRKD